MVGAACTTMMPPVKSAVTNTMGSDLTPILYRLESVSFGSRSRRAMRSKICPNSTPIRPIVPAAPMKSRPSAVKRSVMTTVSVYRNHPSGREERDKVARHRTSRECSSDPWLPTYGRALDRAFIITPQQLAHQGHVAFAGVLGRTLEGDLSFVQDADAIGDGEQAIDVARVDQDRACH